MSPRHPVPRLVLAALLAATAACDRRPSSTAAVGAAGPAGGAVTRWTDSTELFMEHPALVVGVPLRFAVHLTDVTDFAPLRSGRVTLRFRPRSGGALVEVTQDAPRVPGIYGPTATFAAPGTYDLTILVRSPQDRDSLEAGAFRVYATAADAPSEDDRHAARCRS